VGLLTRVLLAGLLRYQEPVVERAVMNHCVPKAVGARLSVLVGDRDAVLSAIVVHDFGMIDGEVGSTLVEVLHGVPALEHQLLDEAVRLSDGIRGSIDKARLRGPPALEVVVTPVGIKRANAEVLMALAALLQETSPPHSPQRLPWDDFITSRGAASSESNA
jgi:hypothetical protein